MKVKLLVGHFIILMCVFNVNVLNAQTSYDSIANVLSGVKSDVEALKKLKTTGWIQSQFQWAESRGAKNFDGGDFSTNSDKRFMIRRGRVKFTYTNKLSQYVLQVNGTERGFNLVEIFGKVTDPWTKSFSLTAGVMNRPFGFEIDQSSAVRETPERSRYTQILMPNERDLGAKITFEPNKDHALHGLRIDAGMYNGQGVAVPGTSSLTGVSVNDGVNEFDFQKDFIGRMCYYRNANNEKVRYGLGVSHYNGGVIQQNNNVFDHYTTDSTGLKFAVADTSAGQNYKSKIASRIYYGAEAFFSIKSKIGTTTLRGEYIAGTQPGTIDETKSPAILPSKPDMYLRQFNGAYAYFIQRIAQTKHEVAVKYEWYDPNSDIKNSDLNGKNGMTKAEIKYTALGIGYNYYYDDNVKLMLYYNTVVNEETGISGFEKDIKDNVLTLRLQYRF